MDSKKSNKQSWLVYILELSDGSFYTGITTNLEKRIKAHFSGSGSKYVFSRKPFRVIYKEPAANRSEASKREYAIKQLSKKKKIELVKEKVDG